MSPMESFTYHCLLFHPNWGKGYYNLLHYNFATSCQMLLKIPSHPASGQGRAQLHEIFYDSFPEILRLRSEVHKVMTSEETLF